MLPRQQAGWTNFPWFVLRFNATLAQNLQLQICRKWRLSDSFDTRIIHKIEITMFIAMNRFKIKTGFEQDFIDIWKGRDTYLETVSGFKNFNLLQGSSNDGYTLFSSHATWESRNDFEAWTKSESFRKAHANAGSRKEIYMGPPQLEYFEVVL